MKKTIFITAMCLGMAFCSGCSKDKEETKKPETLSKQELPVSESVKKELTREEQVEDDLKNALEQAGEEYRTGNFKK